jgi:hypothetical protein
MLISGAWTWAMRTRLSSMRTERGGVALTVLCASYSALTVLYVPLTVLYVSGLDCLMYAIFA